MGIFVTAVRMNTQQIVKVEKGRRRPKMKERRGKSGDAFNRDMFSQLWGKKKGPPVRSDSGISRDAPLKMAMPASQKKTSVGQQKVSVGRRPNDQPATVRFAEEDSDTGSKLRRWMNKGEMNTEGEKGDDTEETYWELWRKASSDKSQIKDAKEEG